MSKQRIYLREGGFQCRHKQRHPYEGCDVKTYIATDRLRTAGRSFSGSLLHYDLFPILNDATESRELRACSCSEGTTEGNERMLEAGYQNTHRSHSFSNYDHIHSANRSVATQSILVFLCVCVCSSCPSRVIKLFFLIPIVACKLTHLATRNAARTEW